VFGPENAAVSEKLAKQAAFEGEVVEGRYFVTIHLSGAIPQEGHDRIHALARQLEKIPKHETEARLKMQRHVFAEMEAWLDRAEHVSHLRHPQIAQVVMKAIAFRQERTWNMFEYVVMPSHLHLFFEVLDGGLKTVLEQFKRWTGHEAGKLLNLDGKRFWQDEWFDHWSRSDEGDEKIVAYIRRNPEKAKLVSSYLEWPYGSWSKSDAMHHVRLGSPDLPGRK
jgi:REP element-mobilizing transposase RayT